MRVKRLVAGLSGFIYLLLLVACGTNNTTSSSNTTSTVTPTSGIATRAFVSNQQADTVEIVNYANDTLPQNANSVAFTISVPTPPGAMWVSADHSTIVVCEDCATQFGSSSVGVISKSKETLSGSITLPGPALIPVTNGNSIVVSPTGTTAWAALPNVSEPNQDGAVVQLDLVNFKILNTIPVPHARHLALSSDGLILLVFGNEGIPGSTNVWKISTAAPPATAPAPVPGVTLDQPVAAYFSADNSAAFILNCGNNCLGTNPPSVAALMIGSTPNIVGTITVANGANVALLDGSILLVAGRKADNTSWLTPVDVTGNVPANGGTPLQLGTGTPGKMALNANAGTLAVGSTGCTNGSGCLAVVNTSTIKVLTPVDPTLGPVTGLASIPNRSIFYAVVTPFDTTLTPPQPSSSRELRIIDATTGQATSSQPLDIVGTPVDVVVVDQ